MYTPNNTIQGSTPNPWYSLTHGNEIKYCKIDLTTHLHLIKCVPNRSIAFFDYLITYGNLAMLSISKRLFRYVNNFLFLLKSNTHNFD